MNHIKSPLVTDLYQFTMLQGYIHEEMYDMAVFEFFVRKLPESRGFLVAAGLESVLSFLEQLRFSQEELEYLSRSKRFSRKLLDYLSEFRFSGDVHAVPEGTICFADEPVVRITASLPEAQFVESRLINLLHYQTLIASKAARCYLAAQNRAYCIDFGLRRSHGAEAGVLAARASYISGFTGTATVIAEPFYDIPIFGTMAHSFVETQDDEKEAFIRFALANPDNVTLLIDTYDTCEGAKKAVETAAELKEKGIVVRGVRLDSGDMVELSKEVRKILDGAGLKDVQIFASGNLDEYSIKNFLEQGAPINGFGIGTKLDTSNDSPYLDCAYKLMEYRGKPRMKKSEGKETLPGKKQVFRQYHENIMEKDILTIEGDKREGQPLLKSFMKNGTRTSKPASLKEIQEYTLEQLKHLPKHFKELQTTPAYPVEISEELYMLKEEVRQKIGLIP
ncbi:MAG: nicotinate phosphoribosyltransferase [Thermodesulfobacteriota bacterium]|nr:nicotinate phosphoribosyltransferase [Thermodesulfobacteriota bacterium]